MIGKRSGQKRGGGKKKGEKKKKKGGGGIRVLSTTHTRGNDERQKERKRGVA